MELLLKELMGYLMAVNKAFDVPGEKEAAVTFSRGMIEQFEPVLKNSNLNLLQVAYAIAMFHAAVLSELSDLVEDVRDDAVEAVGEQHV